MLKQGKHSLTESVVQYAAETFSVIQREVIWLYHSLWLHMFSANRVNCSFFANTKWYEYRICEGFNLHGGV